MCRCQSQLENIAWSDRTSSGPWSRSGSSFLPSAPFHSDSTDQTQVFFMSLICPQRALASVELLWCFITLNHLTSMICLENSHSSVAGKSSSTRTSDSVFRIDTGVSGRFEKSKQFKLSQDLSVSTNSTHLQRTAFTFDSKPSGGSYPFSWEDNSTCVLKGEVGQCQTVDQPITAHPPLVVRFHSDAIFLPNTLYVHMGELHFKGGCLSFKGFLVSQGFADADFTGWNRWGFFFNHFK